MMKRMTALILAVVFLLAMSTVAFAAERDDENTVNAGARMTQSDLNKVGTLGEITVLLSGYSNVNGKTPVATSTFSFRSYGNLTAEQIDTVIAANKTLGAGAMTSTLEGEESYLGSAFRTGSSGSFSNAGNARTLTILTMTGNHYITYSGSTVQGASWYSVY